MRHSLTLAVLTGALLVVACGDEVNVFNDPYPSGGAGGSTSSTSTSNGDGGASTSSGIGGTGPGGSSTGGGSTGGAPPVTEIPCGETTCVTGELCCAAMQQGSQPHCESLSVGCDEDEIPITCNGPSDCTGADVCCVVASMSGGWPPDISPVECVATCEASGGQGMAFTLCEGPEDCDNEPCQPVPMLQGMMVCGGFMP